MKKGLAIVLIIIIGSSAFFLGFYLGRDFWLFRSPRKVTPTIDGIINEKEWRRASYYNLPFYLDVDNSIDETVNKSNVDGWNYLSVGEDDDYYYIALDLCSDRTNNAEGEWIGFFLANRMPDILYSTVGIEALADYGYEYIYYNVSHNKPFDNSMTSLPFSRVYYYIPIIPEMDQMELVYGDSTSTFWDFWNDDETSFTIASQNVVNRTAWSNGDFIDWEIGINVSNKFPEVNATFLLSNLSDLKLYLDITADLTSDPANNLGNATTIYLAVYEHGANPGNISNSIAYSSNPNEISFTSNEYTSVAVDFDHTTVNLTTGMFYFTIHTFNEENSTYPINYNLYIDQMNLRLVTESIMSIQGNTIGTGNYDIAYSFGASGNCPEPHRQFEFKIAKSEFPANEREEVLYLFIAGYGTMSFLGTDFWAYPGNNNDNPYFYSVRSSTNFLKLDMSIV